MRLLTSEERSKLFDVKDMLDKVIDLNETLVTHEDVINKIIEQRKSKRYIEETIEQWADRMSKVLAQFTD